MADEIPGQNAIRVFRDGNRWLAVCGDYPHGMHVAAVEYTAINALFALLRKLMLGDYTFDPSWKPR